MRFLTILFFTLLISSFAACVTPMRTLIYNRPTIDDLSLFKRDTVYKSTEPFQFDKPQISQLPPISDWVENTFLSEYYSLEEFLIKSKTTSFLVIRNDSILYENYFNGYFDKDPAIVFSVSKAITTALVGIAIKEGHIKNVNQKLIEFLPAYVVDERRDITLEHLLQMTSGLHFEDERMIWKLGKAYYSTDIEKFIEHVPLKHPPGTHFAYKSIDTQLLGLCLEKATGKSFSEYLAEKIWDPLGMEFDAYVTKDFRKDAPRVYGGMAACTRDLAKLGRLYLNNGEWNGEEIIPTEWITKSSTVTDDGGGWWGYSTGWWFNDEYFTDNLHSDIQFFAAGYGGQIIFVDPASNVIIVRQGYGREDVKWYALCSKLCNLLNACETRDLRPEQVDESTLTGVYECKEEDLRFRVVQKEGEWYLNGGAFAWFKGEKMKKEGPRALVNHKKRNRLIFEVEKGKAVGMYWDNFRKIKYFEKIKELPDKK